MARTFRVLMSVAVIGAVAYGAYVTRDRWLGSAERLLGYQSAAAPGEQARPSAILRADIDRRSNAGDRVELLREGARQADAAV